MASIGTIGLLLIIANCIVSYKGFNNKFFFERYEFQVDAILLKKDYKRFVTSGFLHINWMHLIFNMLSLYIFSGVLENDLGEIQFLLIYFASLIGGDLFSLFIHRNHGDYSSVGASGAICGIIFASIALYPGMGVGLLFIPFSIPGWLFGLLFVLYSIYGVRSQKNNVGHEAHLGGALIGMLVAIMIEPSALLENYVTILIIVTPTIFFISFIIRNPHMLLVDNLFYKKHNNLYSIDQRYNADKNEQQKELDALLDKIGKKGMAGLSKKEKDKLHELSKD